MKTFSLIILLLVILVINSNAADYYIAQTAAGSDDATSCANAKAITWAWTSPNVAAGDTVHYCGTITTPFGSHVAGTAGNVVTMKFEDNAKFSTTTWTASSAAVTITHDYITLDGGTNGIVEATDNGTTSVFTDGLNNGTKTYNRNLYGVQINGGSNVTVQNLTIRKIYDRLPLSNDCIAAGRGLQIDGAANNITINHNTISDGSFCALDHLTNTSNITFSNNTISGCGVGINVAPGNTSTTGTTINISGNNIQGGDEYDGTWGSECVTNGCGSSCASDDHFHEDGIHIFSQGASAWINGVNIYNNYLQDFGQHSTAHIYIENHDVQNAVIYNNILVNTGTNYAANGMITVKAADGVKIYNNTLVGAGTTSNRGIYWNSNGATTSQDGEIKNNIIINVRGLVGWAVGTMFTADYNQVYNFDTSLTFYDSDNHFYTYAWWLAQGYDAHGSNTSPSLDGSYVPAAPITGADQSALFTTDYYGTTWTAWQAGAVYAAGGGSSVNGACGAADGGYFADTPTLNLCTAGTASAVTGTYLWTCAGSDGGSTANCSARVASVSANATAGRYETTQTVTLTGNADHFLYYYGDSATGTPATTYTAPIATILMNYDGTPKYLRIQPIDAESNAGAITTIGPLKKQRRK